MFTFFSYSRKNKVLPNNFTKSQHTLEQLKFNNLEKTAIIMIEGVGGDIQDFCKKKDNNVYYELISYSSKGLIKDISQLGKDAQALNNHGYIPDKYYSNIKIFKLQNCIKKYIEKTDVNTVIVVGISHGSLLVHSAFLKLQMDMDITTSQIRKIKIFTIGSPRYLPKGLIPEGEGEGKDTLLNFYHVHDPFPGLLKKISGEDGRFKVPDLSKLPNDFKNRGIEEIDNTTKDYEKEEYIYDKDNALVYVNRRTFLIRPSNANTFEKTFIPVNYKEISSFLKVIEKANFYHGSPFILYPVMDIETRYQLNNITKLKLLTVSGPNFISCTEQTGGSITKQNKLTYNKKAYTVYKDKTGKYIRSKNQKVYLKTIKGQYRYNKS